MRLRRLGGDDVGETRVQLWEGSESMKVQELALNRSGPLHLIPSEKSTAFIRGEGKVRKVYTWLDQQER